MTAVSNTSPTSSILQNVYQGARKGAATGALVGTSIVCVTLSNGGFAALLEYGNRVIGNEPKWILFEEDCQLEQFRELSECTNPPLFSSFTAFTAYIVSATTIGGTVIGAVSSVVKNVFSRSHSE